MRKWHTVIQK